VNDRSGEPSKSTVIQSMDQLCKLLVFVYLEHDIASDRYSHCMHCVILERTLRSCGLVAELVSKAMWLLSAVTTSSSSRARATEEAAE